MESHFLPEPHSFDGCMVAKEIPIETKTGDMRSMDGILAAALRILGYVQKKYTRRSFSSGHWLNADISRLCESF